MTQYTALMWHHFTEDERPRMIADAQENGIGLTWGWRDGCPPGSRTLVGVRTFAVSTGMGEAPCRNDGCHGLS
jgi:hypothetical protein